ncbi:AAA ATPase domain-containing protein (plasmid) [Rhizobium gallicum]|uniref:AAA ATPase domain-containing protein n=1 Tax=Rhizobium gallicum TaxID=56730 RepID=A0A1L5NQ89_9HYPH|nr:ATP-binding protein [Rhizobium gallicum]APO70071.1 AAA ATPase domain-containing protein [Rhizobium gallicum]
MELDPSQSVSHRPADGERRAVRNLTAQYLVAATLIYEAIQAGELAWVRLVDPEAGRLDDVIIGRPGRIDAYQIKWSEYRQSVTFNHLVTPSRVSGKPYPAPFQLMADGWKNLKALYPEMAVHAHYLMHDAPSSSDSPGERTGDDQPGHLQSFLRNAFPGRATWFTPGDTIYAAWSNKIDQIKRATRLSGQELAEFVADCELDLGFDLGPSRWEPQARADVEDLAQLLLLKVSKSSGGAVELRIDTILTELNWRDRYDLRFKHDFPIDERLYRPIEPTVQALEKAFAQFDRGYLALVGPPGSGKSTTLTHILRYRKGVRLVRYYAFVRDDPQLGRGEAFSFLHDLCVQLEAMGLGRTRRRNPYPDTLDGLRERLTALLRDLGNETSKTRGRAIILVDGLDHIDREQNPTRSLMEELPAPSALPNGVLIVLGTQPVGLKAPTAALRPINAQLEEAGRKISMEPLSRSSIYEIAQAALPLSRLRPGDEDIIAAASAGHPLSLAYLLKRLANAFDDDAARALLDAGLDFGGDIALEYEAYWDSLASDPEVRDVLGLIARIRGAIDIPTIKQLASVEAVHRFANTAIHLFRQLTPSGWAFFHNSFRQFVLGKTIVDAFGIADPSANIGFHRRLATIAAQPTSAQALKWQELYHLEQASEPFALLERAQQQLFRQQFLAGRPISEISEDVERALKAAAETNTGAAIARLLLIESELVDRHDALSQTEFTSTLLELADPAELAGRFFVSDELLVSDDLALQWSVRLSETRSDGLGLKLFEAAEPMEALAGAERVGGSHGRNLDDWARAAWRFRPLDRLVAAIDNIRGEARFRPGKDEADDPKADETAQIELLTQLGIGIQDARSEAAYAELTTLLGQSAIGRKVLLRLAFRSARLFVDGISTVGDPISAMRAVLEALPPGQQSVQEAATLADILSQIPALSDRAEDYLKLCPSPLTVRELRDPGSHAFGPVEPLFRQARAMAARGRALEPTTIPFLLKDRDEGLVLFQRLVVVVATFWGEAIAGRPVSSSAFLRRVAPVITFRRRDSRETFNWHNWYIITHALNVLYQNLLSAAEAHGRSVFDAVISAFESEWSRAVPPGHMSWPATSRRQVVMSAYRIDRDVARTVRHLDEIETSIDASWELEERLTELCSLARNWIEIGDTKRARAVLDTALSQSFGVYYDKDYQIQHWCGWVARLARSEAEPGLVEQATTTVLRLLPQLRDMNRGRGTSDATFELIGALADRSPQSGLKAAEWLIDEGSGDRSTILSALLAAELRSRDDWRVATGLVAAARLLLPFSSYDTAFGEALTATVASAASSTPLVAQAIRMLRVSAQTVAISGNAYGDILDGVDREDKEDDCDRRKSTPPSLKMPNGVVLDQDRVQSLADDAKEFAKILSRAVSTGGLDWSPIVRALFAKGGGPSVREAANLVLQQTLTSPSLEVLVHAANAAGEVEIADAAITRLIENGRPYGWARFHDGGSRYAVSRALRIAYPTDGRARALKLFVADYTGHGLRAREQIGYLDELLGEFLDELPLPELWRDIEEHVTQLVDWKSSSYRPPSLDLKPRAHDYDISVRLLTRDIDQPALPLAWQARHGLLDVFELGDRSGAARAALSKAIADDYQAQTAGLSILECLAVSNPAIAIRYVEDLNDLAWQGSSVIRYAAQNVLQQLELEIPSAPAKVPLPAFYRLHFPETPKPEISLSGDVTPPGEPLPDTEDPFDLTRMYHHVLKRLASDAELSFDNLVRRMAQLMRIVAPPETWSAKIEREIYRHNERIGLKLTYRRPRSLVAQHAFGLLVSELCDAEVVEWIPTYVREILVVADPPGNLVNILPRPDWLYIPAAEELGKYPSDEWMAAVAEALPTAYHTPAGDVVLAELTRIARQDNDRSEESRLSVIGHRALKFDDDSEPSVHDFWHKERYFARDYPTLWRLQPVPVTAIAGGSIMSDARFLALNPSVAFLLGWRLSATGLFRWENADGEMMAESMRWAQGNIEAHDTGYQNRAAEGWLVLATPAGWEAMRQVITDSVRHRRAARMTGYKRSGDRDISTAADHIPI